ncbi:protelomerase family protein [Hyella patelloides]|nr:protelomerase family protein [Hyella patelloides]
MPRSATPKLPDPNLISQLNAQIESLGWSEFRQAIALKFQQRLALIAAKNLDAEKLKKARFKKLTHEEKVALALCFLHQLISLNQQNLDTESTIQALAIAETAFLERGYTPEFIAKNLHPLYINFVRDAIDRVELKLTPINSYSFEIPERDTERLVEVTQHYAQLYLKYQQPFYRQLSRSGTKVNNLKQDYPQPVRLQPYLNKVNQLLQSDKSTELAAGIAAACGRRFSEVIERGKVTVPQSPTSPYEFVFEGQLKKTDSLEPYITYSLVHASLLISAIERMYEKSKKLRQPSNHNPNHCYMDECFSSFR